MQNDYNDPRWQRLRLRVMDRDQWRCVACDDTRSTLHVHHKRYCGNIWDSPDEDLQTLCNSCHMALGPHPKAGIWYETICQIDARNNVADNWRNKPQETQKNDVAVAVQNCPHCGHREFWSDDGLLKCLTCGWSRCLNYQHLFLHAPATLVSPEQRRAREEANDLAKSKAKALSQLKTWARKCRTYEFTDEEIWTAAFPEHAVPLGFDFDAGGLLTATDLANEDAQKIRAYLTSGMSFRDVVFEIASLTDAGREALIRSGY